MEVERIWRDLCEGELSLPSSLASSWWDRISSEYSQPYRHYHTLQHLSEFLAHFHSHSSLISSPTPFLLAIFFHDIIYLPQSSANEDESIRLFQTFVRECHDSHSLPAAAAAAGEDRDPTRAGGAGGVAWHQRLDQISHAVIELIDLTKSHQLDQAREASLDAKLFCDMDMAILGSSPERYSEYSQQIRKEYQHISLEDFVNGRVKFLTSCLSPCPTDHQSMPEEGKSPKPLFHSQLFHSHYEDVAHRNITWEIKYLQEMLA